MQMESCAQSNYKPAYHLYQQIGPIDRAIALIISPFRAIGLLISTKITDISGLFYDLHIFSQKNIWRKTLYYAIRSAYV